MDTSIYAPIFLNRTIADCPWDNNNNGHIDIPEYRVLQEVNGLALRDSNLETANSVLNFIGVTRSPNTELVLEDIKSQYGKDTFGGCTHNQSDPCAWNAVYPWDFDENSIRYGYCQSSKCFKTESREDRGDFSLSYGAELEQNAFGDGTGFNSKNSNALNKDQLLDPENNSWERFSGQSLQNELGLICTNVSDISHVGSDSNNFSLRYMHENFRKSTIGQPYNGIKFNQYDEMEMNRRLFSYTTENVTSTLLNEQRTSIELLESRGRRVLQQFL
jgi:hypothetical protein